MKEQKGISRSPRELLEYNLLPLVGHLSMLTLALLFLWSNVTTFIHKSPTRIPEVQIPKDPVLECAQALRFEINCDFSVLQDIASGRDLKKFLAVLPLSSPSFYLIKVSGFGFFFLRTVFILLHTILVLYEKYEDKVDPFAEKAMHEIKK
ncbi:hypothetical protein Golob_016400 [Gossypium lobatum]|uniref:Reticulon-like protein n=1 Tax=Gossypium lobatum TaxID=34289 RepID=A0A7J8M423_9ROSI|nr:hypothetical protein [Gossypium lobatum]